MDSQGVDLTSESDELSVTVSWHEPHPLFVIVLVGPDEIPFGIQKDLLCAQSPFYRAELTTSDANAQIESVVRLPDFDVETFGCFQTFIYTGDVYDRRAGRDIPTYTVLLSVWRLATKLRMAPLRMQVLNAMYERRLATRAIPGPDLIIEAWAQTQDGSALRRMLINWAAENLRDVPEFRLELARALPKEILAELVVIMADPAAIPVFPAPGQDPSSQPPSLPNIMTNGLSSLGHEDGSKSGTKRPRKPESASSVIPGGFGDGYMDTKPAIKKARKSTGDTPSSMRKVVRKPSIANGHDGNSTPTSSTGPMTPERELDFCRDLIQRMLSGPGFWTRLVGPFKKAVDPVADKVPNYFDVVKRPMALFTIRDKMARGAYASAADFEADVRQIFQNCYEYWTPDDPIFRLCEQFEKYFYEKWNLKHKWQPSQVKMEVQE